MALKINISFKDTEKDLYDYLKSKMSPSIYLKEYLQKEMEGNTPVKKIKTDIFDI